MEKKIINSTLGQVFLITNQEEVDPNFPQTRWKRGMGVRLHRHVPRRPALPRQASLKPTIEQTYIVSRQTKNTNNQQKKKKKENG